MLNQLDLCGNSAALRIYESEQVEIIQPTAEQIEAKQTALLDRLHNVNDDETLHALLLNEYAWRKFTALAREANKKGIGRMDGTERADLCISAIVLWDMLETVFSISMAGVAEEMATEEANK